MARQILNRRTSKEVPQNDSIDILEGLPLDLWAWKNNVITTVNNTDMEAAVLVDIY